MLFLLFQLGEQRYAIAAGEVQEILPLVAIRPVAHAPEGVVGVADYRGTRLPVVDLARLVLSRPAESRLSTRMVVVSVGDAKGEPQLLGLIAERVTEVVRCAATDFQPCGITSGQAPYLGSMARLNDVLVQRIDLDQLLPAPVREALYQQVAVHHAAQ